MSLRRKTYVTDEYRYEKTDETTIKYVPPLKSPSMTSIVTYSSPRFAPLILDNDKTVNIKIENKSDFDADDNYVTTVYTKTQNNDSDYKYDYKYNYSVNESVETKRRSPLQSKSMTSITKFRSNLDSLNSSLRKSNTGLNSTSFVYDVSSNDDNHRVTYVRQTEDDGLSLAGCLVKSSPSYLPVNRSINVGAIFNGSSFGLLSQHLRIKETFNVSFQFKTTQRNGILMIIVDSNSDNSFFIELYDSQLKATLYIDGEPDSCWTDFQLPILSNDVWVNCEVQLIGNRLTMTVKNDYITKHHRCFLRAPIIGDLYVAGFPATIVPPFVCRSKNFFIGEMRNFYVNHEGIKWYGIPSFITPRLRNWY